MPTKKIKLLLIGPYPPDPKGGAAVLFIQLVQELKIYPELDVIIINTFRATRNIATNTIWALKGFFQLLWLIPQADIVSFHAATGATVSLGPIIWILCQIFKKKTIFRKFGGRFDWHYENSPALIRWLISHTVLNMDILLFETKMLTRYFEKITSKPVRWYPNSRPLPRNLEANPNHILEINNVKKFIFLGHVRPSKGITEILEIGSSLPQDIIIDVYGPFFDGVTVDHFENKNSRVNYCGVLLSCEVVATISEYDVLLLPTYYAGEGYPGVILEAYTCGVPVIATNYNAIPEIVDDSSGILVEPQNAHQLKKAILKLADDAELYAKLKKGTRAKAEQFSSIIWTQSFVDLVMELSRQS